MCLFCHQPLASLHAKDKDLLQLHDSAVSVKAYGTWRWQGRVSGSSSMVILHGLHDFCLLEFSLWFADVWVSWPMHKASESHHVISPAFPPSPQELPNSQIYRHNGKYPQGSKHIQFFYTSDNIQHFADSWHASRHQTRTRLIIELRQFKCSSNLTPSWADFLQTTPWHLRAGNIYRHLT